MKIYQVLGFEPEDYYEYDDSTYDDLDDDLKGTYALLFSFESKDDAEKVCQFLNSKEKFLSEAKNAFKENIKLWPSEKELYVKLVQSWPRDADGNLDESVKPEEEKRNLLEEARIRREEHYNNERKRYFEHVRSFPFHDTIAKTSVISDLEKLSCGEPAYFNYYQVKELKVIENSPALDAEQLMKLGVAIK